ncbi:MAG: hypothetical protein MJY95_04250 [Bacteroidaceae bacterium]|nr:hypothetical protein [Bacteroidaceae bacterium]
MKKTMYLVVFAASSVAALAQVSLSEQPQKPALDITANGTAMSLTKKIDEIPLLIAYDEEVVDKEKTTIDINNYQFSAKNLAAILGVKPKKVKAYRLLEGKNATQIWGYRGINGVLEILSPSRYRQLKKKGVLENFNIAK